MAFVAVGTVADSIWGGAPENPVAGRAGENNESIRASKVGMVKMCRTSLMLLRFVCIFSSRIHLPV
jgi:hypothetical protein